MVYGCIPNVGVGNLVKLVAEKERRSSMQSEKHLDGSDFIYQHENDPKHNVNAVLLLY